MQAVGPKIRRVFGVSAADILNGSIHRFHRDPARVEAILLQNYVRRCRAATFSFGSVTLRTAINAVLTPDRRLLGHIVNWDVCACVRWRPRSRNGASAPASPPKTCCTGSTAAHQRAGDLAQRRAGGRSLEHQPETTADTASESIRSARRARRIGSVLEADRHHRRADAAAGAERHDRGRARWRCRQGLRGGRQRGQELAAATAGATEGNFRRSAPSAAVSPRRSRRSSASSRSCAGAPAADDGGRGGRGTERRGRRAQPRREQKCATSATAGRRPVSTDFN